MPINSHSSCSFLPLQLHSPHPLLLNLIRAKHHPSFGEFSFGSFISERHFIFTPWAKWPGHKDSEGSEKVIPTGTALRGQMVASRQGHPACTEHLLSYLHAKQPFAEIGAMMTKRCWWWQLVHLCVCSASVVRGAAPSKATEELEELDRSCASFDSCETGDFFRTCSCDADCYRYGTCCRDADAFRRMAVGEEEWECSGALTRTPVFVKHSCSNSWNGDEVVRSGCTNETDATDMMSNTLVSSNGTMTTYRNWNCALCNGESVDDLFFWIVVIACPIGAVHQLADSSRLKENIFYSESRSQWGIQRRDEFHPCALTLLQPGFLRRQLRYCAVNVTSTCPSDWSEEEVRTECHRYHGERKWVKNDRYFRNVHCAVCNGVPVTELGCFGRNYDLVESKAEGYTKRVIFDANEAEGAANGCERKSERFDPFLRMCRSIECGLRSPDAEHHQCSSAEEVMKCQASILLASIVLAVVTLSTC